MNYSNPKRQIRRSVIFVFLMVFVLNIPTASGHKTSAYYRGTSSPTLNRDWMLAMPDQLRISELSLPGTHDTMADCCGNSVRTQTLGLREQLDSGIRVLDIRLRSIENVFAVHHAAYFTGHFFGEVLNVTTDFLRQHSGETIIMRVKNERPKDEKSSMSFDEIFAGYKSTYSAYIWEPSGDLNLGPTLGEVRGKIVFLQEFGDRKTFGLDWFGISIQDWYDPLQPQMYDKWERVQNQLQIAHAFVQSDMYINFLSASSGADPYFWASGHSSPGESIDNLWTGISTTSTSKWRDFPRKDCAGKLCSIYYEGLNILTVQYLAGELPSHDGRNIKFTGMVMMDFPGSSLIKTIIQRNPWNWPPVAVGGGDYIVNEGSAVKFDAGASTDKNSGDTLKYRWDFDNDNTWDTDFSTSATANNTWDDDYTGTARVEVTDTKHSDIDDTITVKVNNVDPSVSIDQIADGEEFILTNLVVNFNGSFTDPGADTHTAEINWKDGDKTDFPFPTISPTISKHFYSAAGDYNVLFRVTDDDGGIGKDNATVKILSPAEAAEEAIKDLKDLSGSNPDIRKALVDLEGANNGKGKGGALDHFDADDVNAALVQIEKALKDLIAAEERDPTLDLTDIKELLTVIARSATVKMIQDAADAASTPADQTTITKANALLDEGIVLLEAGDYLGALSKFQDALRQVQDLLISYGLIGTAGTTFSSNGLLYGLIALIVIVVIIGMTRLNKSRKQT